ncbi:cholecystokinin receptor-like [Ruditapes philippinarum]|uniref:cholecystokinin receptor-like n=1 Tax=Ruditapes philippinarum TaxID=129788 RepID=UPI00295B35CA|nr:cholecystokinin receptor-like [Ruditapes philippinarum]
MFSKKKLEYPLFITLLFLSRFALIGIFGNTLVLYVFTKQKIKLSSTIFILTLAGTDLISALVTMPFTIFMELRHFRIDIDVLCKLYHGLATTSIPFSASVMVAIAVDRYMCIVHPYKQMMTIKRAKITVVLLAIFSMSIGFPSSVMYGVNKIYKSNLTAITQSMFYNSLAEYPFLNKTIHEQNNLSQNTEDNTIRTVVVNTGQCHKNEIIVDMSFFSIYQKLYSSYFAACAVIVIILYVIIYKSVLTRRRRRFHLTTTCCLFLSPRHNEDTTKPKPTTKFIMSNIDESPSHISNKTTQGDSFRSEQNQDDNHRCAADTLDSSKESLSLCGVSKAKMEKLRVANIKTALMLSIVALTYLIAFLPAWLMALKVIPMNVIVFYMYFTYNVANPIIYAFLNQNFRNHLGTLLKCRQGR